MLHTLGTTDCRVTDLYVPCATKCGLCSAFLLSLPRGTAVQFEGERFRHTALAARLAFGNRKGSRQLEDPLLLRVLVFPMLSAEDVCRPHPQKLWSTCA